MKVYLIDCDERVYYHYAFPIFSSLDKVKEFVEVFNSNKKYHDEMISFLEFEVDDYDIKDFLD